jgi:hypothetical protein
MKRNKPTYMWFNREILTRDLLHRLENSVDMEFLELSIEILSNIDFVRQVGLW